MRKRPDSGTIKLKTHQSGRNLAHGSKAARYRPPNRDKKLLGEPKIRLLTEKEKIKLKAINSAKITA